MDKARRPIAHQPSGGFGGGQRRGDLVALPSSRQQMTPGDGRNSNSMVVEEGQQKHGNEHFREANSDEFGTERDSHRGQTHRGTGQQTGRLALEEHRPEELQTPEGCVTERMQTFSLQTHSGLVLEPTEPAGQTILFLADGLQKSGECVGHSLETTSLLAESTLGAHSTGPQEGD